MPLVLRGPCWLTTTPMMLTTVPSCLASLMAVKPGSPDIEAALKVVSIVCVCNSTRWSRCTRRILLLTLRPERIEHPFGGRRVTCSRLLWVNRVVAETRPNCPGTNAKSGALPFPPPPFHLAPRSGPRKIHLIPCKQTLLVSPPLPQADLHHRSVYTHSRRRHG